MNVCIASYEGPKLVPHAITKTAFDWQPWETIAQLVEKVTALFETKDYLGKNEMVSLLTHEYARFADVNQTCEEQHFGSRERNLYLLVVELTYTRTIDEQLGAT